MNVVPALRWFAVVALGMLLCAAGGCGPRQSDSSASPASAPPDSTKADLEGRLKAALSIFNAGEKDAALRAVAEAAGEKREPVIAKAALAVISSASVKDEAAEAAALALARAGLRADATEVAHMMSDAARRDATLSKLAR